MIEGEVAALLQGPCSLIVGTVDANGLPGRDAGVRARSCSTAASGCG